MRRRCCRPSAISNCWPAHLAIVGAARPRRRPALGRRAGRRLGGAASSIASGLARGIDAAAHEAALATGTVAVLAGGIDQIYPPQNAGLQQAIAGQGLLLSESPWARRRSPAPFPAATASSAACRGRRRHRGGRSVGLADHRPSRRRTGP
jgi:predicted Rossmann fold nucleotide-binding protein DprA/Smf involved in DNA uptake